MTANALDRQPGGPDDNSAQANHLIAKCVTTSQERQDFDTQDFVHPGILPQSARVITGDTAPTLQAQTSKNRGGTEGPKALTDSGVRRLTPTECERLQGFPDGWTIPDGTDWREYPRPDGPRYAQMGNAVTVPVAEWIGRRLMEYN